MGTDTAEGGGAGDALATRVFLGEGSAAAEVSARGRFLDMSAADDVDAFSLLSFLFVTAEELVDPTADAVLVDCRGSEKGERTTVLLALGIEDRGSGAASD